LNVSVFTSDEVCLQQLYIDYKSSSN